MIRIGDPTGYGEMIRIGDPTGYGEMIRIGDLKTLKTPN